MEGERNKTRSAGGKLWDGMPKSEGLSTIEILHSAPQDAGYNEAHLRCFYTSAHSMGYKQEEIEDLIQFLNHNIIGISETWWEKFCDRCGYRFFSKNVQGRQGGG